MCSGVPCVSHLTALQLGWEVMPDCNPTPDGLERRAGSNVESVAEDEAMRCLILIRNFMEGYQQARSHMSPSCIHVRSSCQVW